MVGNIALQEAQAAVAGCARVTFACCVTHVTDSTLLTHPPAGLRNQRRGLWRYQQGPCLARALPGGHLHPHPRGPRPLRHQGWGHVKLGRSSARWLCCWGLRAAGDRGRELLLSGAACLCHLSCRLQALVARPSAMPACSPPAGFAKAFACPTSNTAVTLTTAGGALARFELKPVTGAAV